MKPAPFTYHAPATVDEALALLAEVAPRDGRVLAGGQSLLPTMAFRLARPAHLVDINGIAALSDMRNEGGAVSIGAGVRHAAFHRPPIDGPLGRLLSRVVRHVAHYPIRVRGTFCGSLAHADPASEWCLVAATLGATMVAKSTAGRRDIPAGRYFKGPLMTDLRSDELLAEARLPLLAGDTRIGFEEFSRRAGDYAIAMSLAAFRVKDGRIAEPHLGVGGVEGTPRRLVAAEDALVGQIPEARTFQRAAEAAAAAVDPIEDAQASARYRRDLVRAMVMRALQQAAA